MIQIQWFLNKRLNIKLATSFTLSLMLILAPGVMAAYEPSSEQKPVPKEQRSQGGTTRGCSGGDLPLTVLASRKYVGQTISSHPTLAWFVPPDSAAKPTEFTMYEWTLEGTSKEVFKRSLQSSPGVMKLSPFSKNEIGLQPGKQYIWQVVIHCDPDNPSSYLVSEASLEVIEMPAATVQSKLRKATNGREKVDIYAKAGLWYNALDEALKLAPASHLGELGSILLNDLVKSEAQQTTPELSPKEQAATEIQIESLKQIARNVR